MHRLSIYKRHFLMRTLFTVLVCGVPATAFSNPTVSLYGIVDLGLYYNHISEDNQSTTGKTSGSQAGMVSGVLSGSRWGIKGQEIVSPDISINVVLEAGINAQNGTRAQGGLGFGRQSTLGVSSKQFGTVEFGRRGSLGYTYLVPIDPFAISGSQAGMGASFGSANGVRPNNLILYKTPTMGGWQASVGYSLNTGFSAIYADGVNTATQDGTNYFGTTKNMRMLTAGLKYDKGPASFFVTYDAVYGASEVTDSTGQTQTNQNNASPKAWIAGGLYDFKVVKVSAAIGQTLDGVFFGQGAGAGGYNTPLESASQGSNVLFAKGARSLQYALSAVIPTGRQTQIYISWQGLKPKGALKENNQLATQNIYSAAFIFSLSKRTDLYAWGSYGTNYQTISNATTSVIGTGVRHRF